MCASIRKASLVNLILSFIKIWYVIDVLSKKHLRDIIIFFQEKEKACSVAQQTEHTVRRPLARDLTTELTYLPGNEEVAPLLVGLTQPFRAISRPSPSIPKKK